MAKTFFEMQAGLVRSPRFGGRLPEMEQSRRDVPFCEGAVRGVRELLPGRTHPRRVELEGGLEFTALFEQPTESKSRVVEFLGQTRVVRMLVAKV